MAEKYWVGGTGNLDGVTTTNISDTDGGAGGATYPAAGDNLNFTAASGGGTVTVTAAVTMTNWVSGAHTGTINTNGQTINLSIWTNSGSGTRTVSLGASAVNLSTWNFATVTNLTFNAGTSTITLSTSGNTFSGASLTYATVIFTSPQNGTITGSNTFGTLTINGGANKTSIMNLGSATQTVSGTFTAAGNSSVNRLLIRSNIRGTQRTISAATVAASNLDVQDINGTGAGSWNLSAITGLSGDCGGNSGITFTSPVTNYWIGAAGNWDAVAEWASSSGGASSSGRVPLPQDTAVFDANSGLSPGTPNVVQNMTRIGSVDWSTATGTPTWTVATAASFFGSITLFSGISITGAQLYTYEGRGSSVLTSAGKSWTKAIDIVAPGGTLTYGDAFSTTATCTHSAGTLNTGGFSVSTGGFVSSGSIARAITITGSTWTITADGNNMWNLTATGLSVNAASSVVRLTSALAADRSFFGTGSFTWGRVEIATTGAFNNTFQGSHTFSTGIHVDASLAARTVRFTASTVTSVGDFTRDSGTNVITITSATAANHTLTKIGGGKILYLDYMSISRSTASPGTTWYAGANSTDGGNNSGWIFGAAPQSATASVSVFTFTSLAGTAFREQFANAAVAAFAFAGVAGTAASNFHASAQAATFSFVSRAGTAIIDQFADAQAAVLQFISDVATSTSNFYADAVAAILDLISEPADAVAPVPDPTVVQIIVSLSPNPAIVVSYRPNYSITVSK